MLKENSGATSITTWYWLSACTWWTPGAGRRHRRKRYRWRGGDVKAAAVCDRSPQEASRPLSCWSLVMSRNSRDGAHLLLHKRRPMDAGPPGFRPGACIDIGHCPAPADVHVLGRLKNKASARHSREFRRKPQIHLGSVDPALDSGFRVSKAALIDGAAAYET